MQRVDVKLKWDLTSPNRPCDEKCPATLVTLVRPTLRMPPSRGGPDNADRQPANLVSNRSFQMTCCKSATLIVLSHLIGLEATEAGPPQLRLTSRATLPSKRANEYCRPARRRVPRRLGAQILIPLYFVRYLTFNSFFGFCFLAPRNVLARPASATTNYLPTLWAEFVSRPPWRTR